MDKKYAFFASEAANVLRKPFNDEYVKGTGDWGLGIGDWVSSRKLSWGFLPTTKFSKTFSQYPVSSPRAAFLKQFGLGVSPSKATALPH